MVLVEADGTRKGGGDPARIAIAFTALVVVALAGTRLIAPSDVRLYERYAHAMVHGSLATGLPKEYPALAGALFVGVAGLPGPYLGAFEACMAIGLGLLLFWGFRAIEGRVWAQRLLVYMALGVATVMLVRFDLVPAALAFVAVACARNERDGWAWIAAWIGAAFKIFPALLLPGFFIYEWRRTGRPPWRKLAAAGAATAALALVQSAVAPGTLWGPIGYEAKRGFEFSSVPGSLSLISSGGHLTWLYGFGNWQVLGPGHSAIAGLMQVIEVAGLVGIWVCLARRRLGVDAASLAVLSLAVLTDRALAPQYLIWLAPLWALWPLRRSWIIACLLTSLTFPVALELHSVYGVSAVLPAFVGAVRNLVLITGTLAWFAEELQVRTIWSQRAVKSSAIRTFAPCELSTPTGAASIVIRGISHRDKGRHMHIVGLPPSGACSEFMAEQEGGF